mmetsp:Transcript_129359/g.242031  ORF Transcript_129359/g.242031 Transcript_129359/m.242031 type:complete len:505 (+) Transcript_129359:37-1551(+)
MIGNAGFASRLATRVSRSLSASGGCEGVLSVSLCGSQRRRYHVAVIGSGPAGFYTSKYLFKQAGNEKVHIDMFERLPVPFGLVRFGVAPDHPEVKNVQNDFAQVAATPTFRFFGNVEVGKHVSLLSLKTSYDAVVVCTGAQGERTLGIAGEELNGVIGAPAFVKWYNGHPDFVHLKPAEPGEAAMVVGQGNVALDIARVLTSHPARMQETDIHGPALDLIQQWQRNGLRTVHVVGRRGFVQAAFTNAELRELSNFSDEVLPIVDPEELKLSQNPASAEELKNSRMKKRSIKMLEDMAKNFEHRKTTSKRIIWLRFLQSPSAILPDTAGAAVAGVRLDRTELCGKAGSQSAVKADPPSSEDVPCGLVVRSVGFDLTPMAGVPMEGTRIPHVEGRVTQAASEPGSLYVSGWVKRGPRGIIASNIADAQETAKRLLLDLQAREQSSGADIAPVEDTLRTSGTRVVSFDDWGRIEAEEKRLGAEKGRIAVKFTDVDEMLRVVGPASSA